MRKRIKEMFEYDRFIAGIFALALAMIVLLTCIGVIISYVGERERNAGPDDISKSNVAQLTTETKTGNETPIEENDIISVIYRTGTMELWMDKQTRVLYLYNKQTESHSITPLYNADGTLRTYPTNEEDY